MSDSRTEKMMSFLKDCQFQCYGVRPYTLVMRKVKRTGLRSCYFVVFTRQSSLIGYSYLKTPFTKRTVGIEAAFLKERSYQRVTACQRPSSPGRL